MKPLLLILPLPSAACRHWSPRQLLPLALFLALLGSAHTDGPGWTVNATVSKLVVTASGGAAAASSALLPPGSGTSFQLSKGEGS
jgi:hypothetical protein